MFKVKEAAGNTSVHVVGRGPRPHRYILSSNPTLGMTVSTEGDAIARLADHAQYV